MGATAPTGRGTGSPPCSRSSGSRFTCNGSPTSDGTTSNRRPSSYWRPSTRRSSVLRRRSPRRPTACSRGECGPTARSRSFRSCSTWGASRSAKTATGARRCSCRRFRARPIRFRSHSGQRPSRPSTSRRTTVTGSGRGSTRGPRWSFASRPTVGTCRPPSTGTSSGRFAGRATRSWSSRATTTRRWTAPGRWTTLPVLRRWPRPPAGRSSAASRGRTSSSHSPRRSGCSSAPSTMPRSLPARARSNATRGS